ncbi:glutamine amidotransferase [Bacillus sp. N9]
MPVELLDHDDRVEVPEGFSPNPAQEHEIIRKFNEWPQLLGYNKFKAKENSLELLKYDNDQFS